MNAGSRRLVLALVALAACVAPREGEDLRATAQAIVKGTNSDASQDATVLVLHYDALSKDGSAGCSGTLLAPRLVMTARHCVATTDPKAACASDGTPLAGGVVQADHDPTKLYVFAGVTRPDFLSTVPQGSKGKEIVDDGANTLCNHDIALIVLDTPLPNGKIAPIRLDGGPTKGEALTIVGWGITETTNTPTTRQQRAASVLEVGPNDTLGNGLANREFLVSEGGCAGDSGGPAFAPSGAVLGALSRGGNGSGGEGADGCIGGTNIYSSAAAFKDLITSAYDKAGQKPWLEGEPDPTTLPPAQDPPSGGGCSVARRAR
jgi:hypothetical protein